MKTEARIQPQTMRAARERAGLDEEELARRLHLRGGAARIAEWERGSARPTFAQAREAARILRVPFASLFLDPETLGPADDLPDLRTIGGRSSFSLDLLDVYRDAQRKVAWAREFRQQRDFEPLPFVGAGAALGGTRAVEAGAQAIADLLGLVPTDRSDVRDPDGYARLLVARAEDAGVLVLRSSTVGANTHRQLDVSEFRGFAISDPLAPLVFINTADAKSAQLFTLIHELAHLWRAETGVSQPALDPRSEGRPDAEALCDAIAAEFLVPADALRASWRVDESLEANADRLRRAFKVSRMVLARRALELNLVTRGEFDPYWKHLVRLAAALPKRDEGGPSYSVMVRLRNGAALTEMVTRAVRGGEMLWRDAARLLGVTPRTLAKFVDQLGGAPG